MSDNQGKLLKDYFDSKGIGATKVASLLGVSRQTVYQYFKTRYFDDETIRSIISKFPDAESVLVDTSNKLNQRIRELESKVMELSDENRALYKELLEAKERMLDKSLSPNRDIVND